MSNLTDEEMPLDDVGAASVDDNDKTMSLMGGIARPDEASPDEFDADAAVGGTKMLGQGTLLLILVAVVAAGGIYVMRITQSELGVSQLTTDVGAKIEQWLARPSTVPKDDPLHPDNIDALLGDTDAIIEMFASDLTTYQVPIEFVKKNPFMLPLITPPTPTGAQVTEVADKKEADRLQELAQQAQTLEVQTIIDGVVPIAMISGEIRAVGQTIGEFKITKIADRSVTLEREGMTFTLQMED